MSEISLKKIKESMKKKDLGETRKGCYICTAHINIKVAVKY